MITSAQLRNLLKEAAKRGQSVLIKADKRAALGRIVEIWHLSRSMGITQTNIATNQE
jgi:biopolymer transport protein ExbD